MQTSQPGAGLCIVRVEVQPDHLLITVKADRNIGRSMYRANTEQPLHFVDPDDALAVVADFLHSFTQPPRLTDERQNVGDAGRARGRHPRLPPP